MTSRLTRVLIVDDDPFMLDMLPAALQEVFDPAEPVTIGCAETPHEALRLLTNEPAPGLLVLSDYDLRDTMDGVELLTRVARTHAQCIRILFSGHSADEIGPLDHKVVHGFVEKPFRLRDMVQPLREIIDGARG